jgi:hypothetical protein
MKRWRIHFRLPEVDGQSWHEALAERRRRPPGERRTLAPPLIFERHPMALLLWLGACEWQDRRIRFAGGSLLTFTFLVHLLYLAVIRWL